MDGRADAATLDCEDTALAWYEGLIATPAWRACSADADCVLARNDARCVAEDGDLVFGGCGLAVATRWATDYEAHRLEREAALCARADRPRCNASSLCGNLSAFCDDGACRERSRPDCAGFDACE